MSQILTPKQVEQPRIVTLAELEKKLTPLCYGNKWALSTIKDLWTKGAPVPTVEGEAEKRILIPEQFKKWWDDLNYGLGFNTTSADVYRQVSKPFSTVSGKSQLRKR